MQMFVAFPLNASPFAGSWTQLCIVVNVQAHNGLTGDHDTNILPWATVANSCRCYLDLFPFGGCRGQFITPGKALDRLFHYLSAESLCRANIHSFIRPFIHSFIHSFINPSIRSVIQSFSHLFIHSVMPSRKQICPCSFIHKSKHTRG